MQVIEKLFSTPSGDKPGILILPDDYIIGEPMPLVVFDAGVGEHPQGSSLSTVGLLYNNGSPLALARDGKLNNIVDPQTGKSYRFAVLGLQGRGWAVAPSDIEFVVRQLFTQYKIDQARVIKVGLSAGGENTLEAIGLDKKKLYVAAIPMSTPQINTGLVNEWKDLTAKVWFFHGTSDGGPTAYEFSKRYLDQINAIKPGYARLTSYAGGHGNWGKYFDPAYTEEINGTRMNIYQFGLAVASHPNFLFTGGSTPPINPPTVATTKAIAKIDAKNGIATFDPLASTGTIKSFYWTVSPNVEWDNGRSDGGTLGVKAAKVKPNTTYTIKLTVNDAIGGSNTSVDTLITDGSGNTAGTVVQPPTPPIPPVPTKTIVAVIYVGTKKVTVYSDTSTEVA